MNDTNDTLPFSTVSYNEKLFTIVGLVSYSLTTLIFPFYLQVYRKNLAQEKNTSLFQVTQHFHRILKAFCYLYYLPFIVILSGFLLKSSFIMMSGVFFCFADNIIILYISKESECLLGILAIQRFFLYFFPSTEKYLGLSKNGFRFLIRSIYLIPPILFLLWLHKNSEDLENTEILKVIYAGILSSFYLFSFFATLFYIPILISIRKLSHLSSAQLNKPQRYILWQLVVMTTVKCISMSILFFTTDLDIKDFPYHGSNIEALCFPLIIELTYLGCNKRHLDTLLGSFNTKGIRTIISFLHCSTRKVAPHQHVYSIGALNS